MRKFLALAMMAGALTWARPAAAESIAFDVNGAAGGGSIFADKFDWLPGNSLLIESQVAPTGTILFQANLGTIVTPGPAADYLNGVGGDFFTVVAVINVTFTGPGTFTVDPGGTFKIYADVAGTGDDLLGTGFTNTGTGHEILSGSFIANPGFSEGSLVTSTGPTVNGFPSPNCAVTQVLPNRNCLDQFNNNEWVNYYSYSGTGGTNGTVRVNTFDSNYFTNLIAGTSISFTSTQNNLPFRQVDPSRAMSSNAVANGDVTTLFGGTNSICGAGELGTAAAPCINGNAFNILAETDASTVFQGVTSVPEPATLTLLGAGLLGAAALRRRQTRKS